MSNVQTRLLNAAGPIAQMGRTGLPLTIVGTMFDQKYLYTGRPVVRNVQVSRGAMSSSLCKISCSSQSIEAKQSSFYVRIESSSSIA